MKPSVKNLTSISFWKRNPNSMESVDRVNITLREKNVFEIKTASEEKSTKREFSKEEADFLLDELLDHCDIMNEDNPYRAYLYEDTVQDFSLKFFLSVELKDFSYIAIKGLHPFKQPHYREILNLFNRYFEK